MLIVPSMLAPFPQLDSNLFCTLDSSVTPKTVPRTGEVGLINVRFLSTNFKVPNTDFCHPNEVWELWGMMALSLDFHCGHECGSCRGQYTDGFSLCALGGIDCHEKWWNTMQWTRAVELSWLVWALDLALTSTITWIGTYFFEAHFLLCQGKLISPSPSSC